MTPTDNYLKLLIGVSALLLLMFIKFLSKSFILACLFTCIIVASLIILATHNSCKSEVDKQSLFFYLSKVTQFTILFLIIFLISKILSSTFIGWLIGLISLYKLNTNYISSAIQFCFLISIGILCGFCLTPLGSSIFLTFYILNSGYVINRFENIILFRRNY